MLYTGSILYIEFIAEPKGEASNCDALSFRVGMYVYPQRLCNPILCLCMYIRHACAMLVQQRDQNVPWGDDCGLSGGRFAQEVPITSYLAAWLLT